MKKEKKKPEVEETEKVTEKEKPAEETTEKEKDSRRRSIQIRQWVRHLPLQWER